MNRLVAFVAVVAFAACLAVRPASAGAQLPGSAAVSPAPAASPSPAPPTTQAASRKHRSAALWYVLGGIGLAALAMNAYSIYQEKQVHIYPVATHRGLSLHFKI
ncbi:MAG TPA: hypothetical protein VIJ12_10195 [Candidatus Baltobacteraceae bacterium]